MEALLVLALVVVSLVVGLSISAGRGWHRTEREEALLAELDALKAVNRLRVAAWQARQAMRDEVRRARQR